MTYYRIADRIQMAASMDSCVVDHEKLARAPVGVNSRLRPFERQRADESGGIEVQSEGGSQAPVEDRVGKPASLLGAGDAPCHPALRFGAGSSHLSACPEDFVTRGQIAAFLFRASDDR